ncbi:Hypothetical_protein [Hexamita inflata]|uniref:Hypothetical_protein n=1 Tax=Hexamita inflata TaxID=28002 RepID=A0AA86RH47_9EUKA|nr:Hypothetical protein HINF_LOCUS65571 [Hexamita inflata]
MSCIVVSRLVIEITIGMQQLMFRIYQFLHTHQAIWQSNSNGYMHTKVLSIISPCCNYWTQMPYEYRLPLQHELWQLERMAPFSYKLSIPDPTALSSFAHTWRLSIFNKVETASLETKYPLF